MDGDGEAPHPGAEQQVAFVDLRGECKPHEPRQGDGRQKARIAVALEPRDRCIIVYTLRMGDEVIQPKDAFDDIPASRPNKEMIEIARILNPSIETVVRTHSEEEAELLRQEHADMVFMGEHELALGMMRHIEERLAVAARAAT